jgi:tryptophan synthase beta chain
MKSSRLFGIFGGRFVAETLMPLILELERPTTRPRPTRAFQAEMDDLCYLKHYVGRPSPLYFAERLTEQARRRQGLFQARRAEPHRRAQDQQLLGQILLAKRMGKTRIIAETGAGQHGVATATGLRAASAALRRLHGRGRRRAAGANVFRMKLLGAEVRPVTSGAAR